MFSVFPVYFLFFCFLPYSYRVFETVIYKSKAVENNINRILLRNVKNITSKIHFWKGFISLAKDDIDNRNREIISSSFLKY